MHKTFHRVVSPCNPLERSDTIPPHCSVPLIQLLHGPSDPPTVQICDFGVARRMERGKPAMAKTFMGSPGYISPQVRTRRRPLTRADAQAGVVLSRAEATFGATAGLSVDAVPSVSVSARCTVQVISAGLSGGRKTTNVSGRISVTHCAKHAAHPSAPPFFPSRAALGAGSRHSIVMSSGWFSTRPVPSQTADDAIKADVWSCGVLLFILLTGELPVQISLTAR